MYDRKKESDRLADQRTALICTVLAKGLFGKQGKKIKLKDFMPQEKKRQTWQEQLKQVEYITRVFGGKDNRGVKQ